MEFTSNSGNLTCCSTSAACSNVALSRVSGQLSPTQRTYGNACLITSFFYAIHTYTWLTIYVYRSVCMTNRGGAFDDVHEVKISVSHLRYLDLLVRCARKQACYVVSESFQLCMHTYIHVEKLLPITSDSFLLFRKYPLILLLSNL